MIRLRRQSVRGFVYIQHKENCCHKLMEATQGPWVSGTSSEDNDKKNSLFSHSSLKSIETFSWTAQRSFNLKVHPWEWFLLMKRCKRCKTSKQKIQFLSQKSSKGTRFLQNLLRKTFYCNHFLHQDKRQNRLITKRLLHRCSTMVSKDSSTMPRTLVSCPTRLLSISISSIFQHPKKQFHHDV